MRTLLVVCIALAVATFVAPPPATAEPAALHFVSFELGDVLPKTSFTGVFRAAFAGASAEAPTHGRAGEALAGTISLPAEVSSGEWSVSLAPASGAPVLEVRGVLSADGIQILGSHVDGERIELPRDTTSLRVVKGYVSATVTLLGRVTDAGCCTATLGLDADADGEISAAETRSFPADGHDVKATVRLERAAPSVPYLFTIATPDGKVVARASGTYSFTKLNGVSANGEFDPDVVEYVTGTVERDPHLLQHDVGSSILLQTVPASAKDAQGPRVFFTMGTPSSPPPAAASAGDEPAPAPAAPTWGERALLFLAGPAFLAVLAGSFAAALLAFAARRLLERAG